MFERKHRASGRWIMEPPFNNALHALHIKAVFGRCCPRVHMVANFLRVISLSRTMSGQCCSIIQTDVSHLLIRVWKGNPNTSQTLTSIQTVLPCHPDGCTLQLFKHFSTLMGVQKHHWSRRKQRIRLLLSWNLHIIFLDFWNSLLKTCDTKTCHNKALSNFEK